MSNQALLMLLLLSAAFNLGVLGRATYHYCGSRMEAPAAVLGSARAKVQRTQACS